jgi:hypothetical protein
MSHTRNIEIAVGCPEYTEDGVLEFIILTVNTGTINLDADAVTAIAECAASADTGLDLEVIQALRCETSFTGQVWILGFYNGEDE